VTATVDNGIVAIGKTRSYGSEQTDLTVMKYDENGKLIWHKIYGFKYYEYGNAVATTRDGGFILVGGTNTLGKGNHSAYVLALDKAGELIWSHVYGDERKDVAHGVARMSDGSVIVVGESNSFKRAKNFYMIKLIKRK
jgi:predicted SpoU family rRNA methylase